MKNTNLPHKTKKFKYSIATVCNAIKKTNGLLSYTARELQCSYSTVLSYINKFPEVARAYEDILEMVLDIAENNIRQDLKAGSVETAKWILRYKGRQRGYIEKETIEIANAPVSAIPITEKARELGLQYLKELTNGRD